MIARLSTTVAGVALALATFTSVAGAQAPQTTATPVTGGGVAAPVMAPLVPAVTASVGGLSLSAMPDQTLGHVGAFSGRAPAGRLIHLQRQDTRQRWKDVATARSTATGAFVAHWRPDHIGPTALRALLHGTAAPISITVFKPALATWYGPGFFGNQTACGVVLTPDMVGVAHRTLPCGTQVAIAYGGRTMIVPVIDRGPYGVAGAQYDLTQATALTLGITTTETIGAVSLKTMPAPVTTPQPSATPQSPATTTASR
jgi:rare lipoprotein A